MIDPYRMVVVNLIASLILLLGLFLYSRFFPKRRISLLVLLILISILPVISIFRKGVYESGDFVFHIYHAMDFTQALLEGVLIPSWSEGLNSTFGHPVFQFIYVIPYYLMSFLHFLGFTFIFSERLVLAGAFTGSGILMWFMLKKLTKNDLASFAGSIIYLFSPYHLVDIHFRVAIAESLAFAITPAIFLLLLKIKEKPQFLHFVWLSLLTGILFLTHPAMFVIYSGLFLTYVLFEVFIKRSNTKLLLIFIASYFVGLIISSFGWLTRLTLTKFTQGSHLINIPIEFVEPIELLISPWRFGFLFQGPYGELSFVIGYGGVIILFLSLCLIFKRKNKTKNFQDIIFWTIIAVSTIFIMLPFSKFFWDTFKFLNLMQFAYRFLHPLIFCLAILTAYLTLLYLNKKRLIYIFLFLVIGYTILNWGNRGTIPEIDDKWIRNNLPNGTKQGEKMIEATPLWWNTEKDFLTIPKKHLEVAEGSAQIKQIERKTTRHTYAVLTDEPTTLVENTLYFPDWKIFVNGNEVPIDYKNPNYNARMVFKIPQGLNLIEVKFDDIYPIKIAKRLSLITTLILAAYLVLYYTSRTVEFFLNKTYKFTRKKWKRLKYH